MYKVIKSFTDLQDGNHVYFSGESYPRRGYVPTGSRIAELSGKDNKTGCPLIVEVPVSNTPTQERGGEAVSLASGSPGGVHPSETTEAKKTPKKARRKASKEG